MCAIYLGHPKLCHQPDHPFISGLRAHPTKIRLSSTLTEGPLKMPPSWKTGFLSLSFSLSVAPFLLLTAEGPPNSHKLHKEILTKKDTLWNQLWWCRKSKQKPGTLSPQWANRSWNPERGLLWFICVFLSWMSKAKSDIFLQYQARLTSSKRGARSATRQRDGRKAEGRWSKEEENISRCRCESGTCYVGAYCRVLW